MIKARRTYSIIFLCFLSIVVFSQTNLVPNPSFEQYTSCPNNVAQVNFATGWSIYANTPDYFNVCGNAGFSVPLNTFGYQYPVNGSAYMGFLNYLNKSYIGPSNWREHIGRDLSTTLTIGTKYYASFKVVLTLSPIVPSNCASSKMGVLFSTIPYSMANSSPTNNAPKVYSNSIITDTLNWTKIFGSFVADSAYKYLAIGNFFKDANTDTLILGSGTACASYYFVDDICVSTDSAFTANYYTGIHKNFNQNLFIYPNPVENFLFLSDFDQFSEFKLCDLIGTEVKFEILKDKLDLTNVSPGIYFLSYTRNRENFKYKILKK